MLRQFSVYLDGDLSENFEASKLTLDNDRGKGYISLYELLPGITAWIYNINLVSDLEMDIEFSEDRSLNFGYNVEGHQLQKFPEDKKFRTINQSQNFILKTEPGSSSKFIIPKGIDYKCCYLIINPKLLKKSNIKSKRRLLTDLNETFGNPTSKEPYRYFGDIDVSIATYAKIVVNNNRTDLIGRLTTEGAVLNMLSAQIASHDNDQKTDNFIANLTKEELSKITSVGDYILKNITEKLSVASMASYLDLSQKKVQAGIRFLYGCTANDYTTRIRLEHAKQLLHSSDLSISEICYGIGYQSRSYFSKIFIDNYGVTPSSYRKSFQDKDVLFEISYRSTAVDDLTSSNVDSIITQAIKENAKHDVTGCLIYHNRAFFQIIEGSRSDILRLYRNIQNDNRHTDVKLLWRGYKLEREFEDWAMASVSDNSTLSIPVQGSTKTLELNKISQSVHISRGMSDNLWKKVRNVIKVNILESA